VAAEKKIAKLKKEKIKEINNIFKQKISNFLKNITVVLIEPKVSGNIGAISRAMKNFSLKNLILVNPKCKIDDELLKRAKHSKDVIASMKIVGDFFNLSGKFDYVIGTTAILGRDKHILRVPISPGMLISNIDLTKKIVIVFGREGDGLNNKELAVCNILVSIPTDKNYATLNIATAASIIFYEIYQEFGGQKITKQFNSIEKRDLIELNKSLSTAVNSLSFKTDEKKKTQKLTWKRIFGKSFLTKKEFLVLMGFFKKILKK